MDIALRISLFFCEAINFSGFFMTIMTKFWFAIEASVIDLICFHGINWTPISQELFVIPSAEMINLSVCEDNFFMAIMERNPKKRIDMIPTINMVSGNFKKIESIS